MDFFCGCACGFHNGEHLNAYHGRVCSNRRCVSSGLFVSLRRRNQERSGAPENAGIHAYPHAGLLADPIGVSA